MKVYIGIGTNSGLREKNIESALSLISGKCGSVTRISPVYETEPWGFMSNQKFLNLVAETDTWMSPADFLSSLLSIETLMGRRRDGSRYTSRIIDLDIIYFDSLIISAGGLVIPHPLMQERKFVLVPLCDLVPDFADPRNGKTVRQLLAGCRDQGTPVPYPYNSPLSAKL